MKRHEHLLTYFYRQKGEINPRGALQVLAEDPHEGEQKAIKMLYDMGHHNLPDVEMLFAGYYA